MNNQASGLARLPVRVVDRWEVFPKLLASLVEGLEADRDATGVRGAFESALRQAVSAREVRIREGGRPVGHGRGAAAIEIPSGGAGRAPVLEACFDEGYDEGTLQALHAAAHLARLVIAVERWASSRRSPRRFPSPKYDGAAPLIGSSPVMCALRERIERLAGTDFTVLIEGESGTGKELVARQIHDLSPRSRGPFVAINCAALVETLLEAELFGIEDRTATGVKGRRGKFEHADGGTLFLDEVSDLSLTAQAKLLRAIQELAVERVGGTGTRRVDTRIVVATNRGLSELCDKGLFRHDLYYRLSGVELRVPPLRTRREDIFELATYFLERYRTVRPFQFSRAAAAGLCLYDWPGNVRELERLIEGVVALAQSDCIELDDLPPVIRGGQADALLPSLVHDETMRAWGSRYARLVLERCGDNKRRACRRLGISYHTLQAYLRYRPKASDDEARAAREGQPRGAGAARFEPPAESRAS